MRQYYAVIRSDDFLAHYGIKGMRWHMKKAIEKGNVHSYKRYRKKAEKKLKRFEKQASNGPRYSKRALQNVIGLGTAVGKMAFAATNPQVIAYRAGLAGYNAYRAANTKKASDKAKQWRNEIETELGLDALYSMRSKKHSRKR